MARCCGGSPPSNPVFATFATFDTFASFCLPRYGGSSKNTKPRFRIFRYFRGPNPPQNPGFVLFVSFVVKNSPYPINIPQFVILKSPFIPHILAK